MNIVILNGWAMPSGIWAQFCDLLKSSITYTTCRVIDIDRSFNASEWMEYLDDLIEPDTLLIGWSLGGMLALEYAHQYPEKLRGICSLQMNPKFVAASDWPSGMAAETFQAFKLLANSEEQTDIKRLISQFSFLVTAKGVDALGDLKALKVRFSVGAIPSVDVLSRSLELLELLDVRDKISTLTVPQLHLLGERDQLVPSSVFKSLASLNGRAHVEVLDGVSHCPCYSASERMVARIAAFSGGLN